MARTITEITQEAIGSYSSGVPVLIESVDGTWLHGQETWDERNAHASLVFKWMGGVDSAAFEASNAREILEAERKSFWERRRNAK